MRLAIVSHKVCWNSSESAEIYRTDGGFPIQIKAVSELFDETKLLVPCKRASIKNGSMPLEGKNLQVSPLSVAKYKGFLRKLSFPVWLLQNGRIIWREIKQADAVHVLIPGDIGTIGFIFALLLKKPLFVRHCGNWLIQKTFAENFWKWSMERFAGGQNAMFATGATENAPSERNSNIKWIFSTSLRNSEMEKSVIQKLPDDGRIKLITVCRLENRKGVDLVLESLPAILEKFPGASLEIVGGGLLFEKLKEQAKNLEIEKKVIFHGKVSQPEVIELMKQANIFCFPTSASEGFPKVVIEALACGLPVITTKVSALPQLIGHGGGILLDEATSENLAKAVISVCADAEKYSRLSAKAIVSARRYSLESWQDYIGENLRQVWNVSSFSSASG